MKLRFLRRHRSIRELPDTELPAFVLLTGVNGAGKTHLLTAILENAIGVDVAPSPKEQIRYFDWNSLTPSDAAQMSTPQLYQERDQILQHVDQTRQAFAPTMGDLLGSPALRDWPHDGWELARLSKEEFFQRFGNRAGAGHLYESIRAVVSNAAKQLIESLGGHRKRATPLSELAESVAAGEGTSAVLLEYRHFRERHIRFGSVDIFQQSFAHLFLAYFERQKLNRLYRMTQEDGRAPSETPLSEVDFLARHGKPPWDFVNETLEGAALDFEIDHPTDWAQTHYTPTLTKRSSGVVVPFSSLSSGEKVLMSFALCLYNTADKRLQLSGRPKLLLLDEVDAPLHPSMARRLISTVTEVLVQREGIRVIMTTHSPSTVAVAPEESIFVMEREPAVLRPSTKAAAVGLLTSELPTLSLSFDGRRQVFVESHTDAELYDSLFQGMRASLQSERSLVFIGAGHRPANGPDKDGGCDKVLAVVKALVDGGNGSVFGLVDWDKKRSPNHAGRIHVLAHAERYAIENCLLDPLLLAAASVREKREFGDLLEVGETYSKLGFLSVFRLQAVVDKVQRLVLEIPGDEQLGPTRSVHYIGELVLQVSESYLFMNGHALEAAVKAAFPHLRKFTRQADLLKHVANNVAHDMPEFVPRVVKDCFIELLGA